MKEFIKKHPVTTYFILAFVWTWTIAGYMLLSGQSDVASPGAVFILCGISSNISPSIAAFLVSRVSEGKEGVDKLKNGFRKKVAPRYLLMALFSVPLITIITAIISSHTVREYQFQITVPMIFMGLVWPLFSGFGEEFGWRGYILPKLINKLGLLKAALLLGFVWEVWHIPMHYMAYRGYGEYLIPAFITIGFLNLILQTVIMAYLFVKSQGSILLMIIYHYTITASSIVISGFFRQEATPRAVFLESVISVTIFAVYAIILYVKKGLTERSKESC